MRITLVGLAATALVATLASPAFAKMETVTGVLVDQACYLLNQANIRQKHAMKNGPVDNCATTCAKKGEPVAVITPTGKMYVVIGQYTANKNRILVGYMTHTVAMTGDVSTAKDGSATISAISIKDVQ
jgi:hypothetical protein